MKYAARALMLVCAFALVIPAFADDQEKADKEIKKIGAITADPTMRSVVNRTLADMMNVKRLDLVKERQSMNLTYGGVFLAHQLAASGAKMDDIAAQLKAGKSIMDIANDQHANWKQIGNEAKKANKKIDENIEKYFQNTKKEAEKNQADDYVAQDDHTAADSDISKADFADAQSRYQHLHDMAMSQLPSGDANTRNSNTGQSMSSPSSPGVGGGGRH